MLARCEAMVAIVTRPNVNMHRLSSTFRACDRIWSPTSTGHHESPVLSAAPKLVHAMVKGLRRKLGDDAAKPAYMLNERGVGYRMPRPAER